MSVLIPRLDDPSYMLAADAAFWDRNDAKRVFVGRMTCFGHGYFFIPPNTFGRRAWSCSILTRSWEHAKYEPRRLGPEGSFS